MRDPSSSGTNAPRKRKRVATGWIGLGGLAALWLAGATGARAQEPAPQADPGAISTNMDSRMEARADKLEHDRKTGLVEARGNVYIRKGTDELTADYLRFNTKTEEAEAFGNVILKRATGAWTGNRVRYNFRTQESDSDQFTVDLKPFQMTGEKILKGSTNYYQVVGATVTTCSNKLPNCHYRVRVSDLEAVPGDHFTARRATVYLGPVPIFYLPYWYRNLRENVGFRFYPGYSSRDGAFLLSAVRYRLSPTLRGTTHLDYRTERGVAGGQDFKWLDPAGQWNGDLRLYYADDQEPWDEDEDPALSDLTSDRYRVRLRHTDNLSEVDLLLLQASYLSDTDVLEDFFEDEYRESRQPENYVSYSHRAETYTLNAGLQARLNDFYSGVNRIPEVSADFVRQEMFGSPIYYEGRTAASFLQRVFPEADEDSEEYSAFRVDSRNLLLYPGKYLGFLSVIPRAGYRATYYSKTRGSEAALATWTETTTSQVGGPGGTNTVVTTVTRTGVVTNEVESGAKMRSLMELGMEASYKAFASWEAGDGALMRHVVEPYANYTFVPEPNLLPDNIYQFDDIDQLGEVNGLRLGARNKIQIKREEMPADLVDADTYVTMRFNREGEESVLDQGILDVEVTPNSVLAVNVDAIIDLDEGDLETSSLRLTVKDEGYWEAYTEYRFRKDVSSLALADLTLLPKRRWSYNAYGRYELDESRLEEIGGYLQRNLDCLAFRLGVGYMPGYTKTTGGEEESQVRIIFGAWLTAFPGGGLMGRYTPE